MKKALILIIILLSIQYSFGQTIGYLRNDTTIVTNLTKNATLVIESSTKNVLGGLWNMGNGRTAFKIPLITDISGLPAALNARVPLTRTITIFGTTLDLSADRTFTASNLTNGYGLSSFNYNGSAAIAPKVDSAEIINNARFNSVVGTTALARINQRVKYTDTAAMLAPYSKNAFTILINNLQNYTAYNFIGDSNWEGYGLSPSPNVGPQNSVNIIQAAVTKPTGVQSIIGFTNFTNPTLYGLTISGTTSITTTGPTNTAIILQSGASISFTAAANTVDFWFDAATTGGNILMTYNGSPYRTVTCNNINGNNRSSFDGTFATPSSASGTYTLTATGGSVTITALFQSILKPTGKNASYFLRQAVSSQSFQSFSPTNLANTTALQQNAHALFFVALGTNSIYASPSTSTQFGIDLLNYANALNVKGNRMLYLIPPNVPGATPPLEAYSNYHDVAINVCTQNNIPYLDLNSIGLISSDYLSAGNVHYNASGHAKIAAAVIAYLSANDISHQDIKLSGSRYLDQTGSKQYSRSSGTNTYTATILPTFTALTEGQIVNIFFANANSSSTVTLNINGLGAYPVRKFGQNALAIGDIDANQGLSLLFDGTYFQIMGDATNTVVKLNAGDASIPGTLTIGGNNNVTGAVQATSFASAYEFRANSFAGGKILVSTGTTISESAATTIQLGYLGSATGSTGSGNLVLGTSPTLVTPNLGTPSALVGTNITGTAAALNIGGSAASLVNARTIWGQSFNGTANVSGAFSGATTGSFSGTVGVGGNLNVTGNSTITAATTLNGQVNINNNTRYNGTNGQSLTFATNGTNSFLFGNSFNLFGSGSNTDWNYYLGGNNSQNFQTNGTLRLVIDGSGNINIPGLTASLPVFTDGSKNLTNTGVVPISNGGTGSATQNFVDLTTTQGPLGDKTWGGIQTYSNNTIFNSGSTFNSAITLNQQLSYKSGHQSIYYNFGNTFATSFGPNTLTGNRGVVFPDESGTMDLGFKVRLTGSGTGAATTISIAHGLSGITSSSIAVVTPVNAASSGISYVTTDATNINIVYTVAPASGTNNLSYNISIKP